MDFSALGCWMGGSLQSTCSQLCHKLPTVRYELLRYSLGICAFFVNFWYVWLSGIFKFQCNMIFRNFHYIYHHHYHHHLCFNVCFSCLHGLDGILWKTSLLFQITSDCLIPSFPRLLYRDTTTNHDQAHSLMLSPHDQTIAVFYPVKILSLYKIYNPKFLRNLILRPNTAHQFNHTKSIFPVQYDYIFLFNWSSLTSI